MKKKLSVIIVAGNEEKMIKDCLASCDWADEVILVAANSSDNTKTIAQKYFPKIKIFETEDEYNKNFSKWRNIGFQNATGDWLLYIDSDERITPELKKEIQAHLTDKNPRFSYFVIPRANYFLGKRVKHGGTYPDYVKRLFQKKFFNGFKGILHEEPDIHGDFGYLKSDLIHLAHRDLHSMFNKTIAWTDVEAKGIHQNHHPKIVWWRFLRMMFTKFWQRMIIQSFWQDGIVGWISTIFEMFDTFIIYARLWELQNADKESCHL